MNTNSSHIMNTHILVGRDKARTVRSLEFAVGLFLVSVIFFFAMIQLSLNTIVFNSAIGPLFDFLWWEGFLFLIMIPALIQAYYNKGFLVSWVLVFAPVAGAVVNHAGIGILGAPPGLLESIKLAIVVGVIVSLPAAIVSFLLGITLRYVVVQAH